MRHELRDRPAQAGPFRHEVRKRERPGRDDTGGDQGRPAAHVVDHDHRFEPRRDLQRDGTRSDQGGVAPVQHGLRPPGRQREAVGPDVAHGPDRHLAQLRGRLVVQRPDDALEPTVSPAQLDERLHHGRPVPCDLAATRAGQQGEPR